jgi:TrfA protein
MSDITEKVLAIGRRQRQIEIETREAGAEDQKRVGVVEIVEKIGLKMVFWPEGCAAMPTELTRVSLFGLPADKPGARKMLRACRLDSRSDVEVLYTGEQLGAKEETTWLACLRLSRGVPMGERVYLNLTHVLHELKLANTGGKRGNRQAVMTRLDRLSAAHFKVHFKRGKKTYSITTGMLKWGIENETGAMYIRLDPDGAVLFENLAYQPWDVRLSLQSDVSARMLSYVSGHEQGKPHSQTLDNLKRWCGYGGRLRQFRASCVTALEELEAKGVLGKGSVKIISGAMSDVVCWVRLRMPLAIESK